ncbi:TIR domain-containing protein [Thalassolituus sp. ST750PaO-4]|uniref:TIR domain-containing protein n=1 Tax=Thalassolituus sp. ST750PaO-4 TaxID=2742965 RepID=UPI001CE2338E|nr:TIR domain-containing protein [Thalassolituus sp. ST750PaO-4]MCA6060853.1 TIR domain-containing protein [Thalassolituus sp. ST750PaO-4]
MELFISWSGEQSKKIAEAIREWIPCVIQAVKPYFTPEDINKGQRWSSEISKKLESSKIGIIVLTPYNLDAPWLMFEAGALSKSVDTARVCPLLFGVTPAEVKGPLVQFQCSGFNRPEAMKLLRSINHELGDEKLEDKTLNSTFDVFWPQLNEKIENILSESEPQTTASSSRSDRDILEEVLRLTRKSAYSHVRSESPNRLPDFFEKKKPVTFDPETGVISFWSDNSEVYDFTIDRLTSGSEVLDWFLQVGNKGWCTGEHLKAFIDCLEEMTDLYFENNAQGVFCPGGANKVVDWDAVLTSKASGR